MIIKEFMGLYFRNKYCKILPTFRLKVERGDRNDQFRTNFAISRNASSTKRRNYESKREEQRLMVYNT